MKNRAMDASSGPYFAYSEEVGASAVQNGGEDTTSEVDNGPLASEGDFITAESNVDSKFQSMTEKGIRRLCLELLDLKKASTEELRRNVYSNHSAFVRISQQVADLEQELMELKMHISSQGSLVHDLMDGVYLEALSSETWMHIAPEALCLDQYPLLDGLEKHTYHLSEVLDVLLSEHKEEEALALLDEEETAFPEIQKIEEFSSSTLALYKSALSEQKARLAEQFAQIAKQPRFCGTELRKALSGLCRLGDGPRAHTLLLSSYHSRLQSSMQSLLPSSAFYRGTYTKTLAQLVFSAISLAAKDSVTIFGEGSAYASELVMWARKETEKFVQLVKKYVLSFSETAGGLRAAAECVHVAVGHCCLLEAQGIALCPYLLKLIRPCIEEVLGMTLKRVEIIVSVFAANDDWKLISSPIRNCFMNQQLHFSNTAGGFATHFNLTSSAHKFISMVQDIVEDAAALASLHIGECILDGIACLFDNYIDILIRAIPCRSETENKEFSGKSKTSSAETEVQQLAILANATALADVLLPNVVSNISGQQFGNLEDPYERIQERSGLCALPLMKHKDWRHHIQRTVDRLRDHFCQQYVLGLICSREGYVRLTAVMYLDGKSEDLFSGQNPMPSSPFQALFEKLIQLAQLAANVFVGRRRVATQLLMRLTETVVIWLSNDREFWEVIEHGSAPLNPFGLQQFILDMHFVIECAVSGHYSSRHLRQIVSDLICRAISAFSATGRDASSAFPEEDRFSGIAREAINKLLNGWSQSTFEAEDIEPEEDPDGVLDGEPDRNLYGAPGREHDLNDKVLHQEPDGIPASPTSLISADSFASAEFEGGGSPQYYTDSES